jgi:hypothetical protein
MLTEDQVAVRLHAGVDDIHAPANLAAAVRRRHTRRTRALIGMTAVPVVAAAVAAVALVAAPTRPNQPNLRNAAYVAGHAVAALEGAADRMAHIRGTVTAQGIDGQTLEQWRDPAGSRWRVDAIGSDGRPRRAMLVAGPDDGTRTVLTVDYAERAWWTYHLEQPDTPSDVSWISMFDDPDDIRDALRLWSLHLVGNERVDGQDTVHLGGPKPTGRGIAIDIWVDAATYLPVRITVVSPDLSIVSRYTWLARTPQNLAPFELKAPAGFTQRQH